MAKIDVYVKKSVLVIGGTAEALKVAYELSCLGLGVTLIEENVALNLNKEVFLQEPLKDLLCQVKTKANIKVLTSARLENLEGQVGNFKATVSVSEKKEIIEIGAVVVATGYRTEFRKRDFGFDLSSSVISLSTLQKFLALGQLKESEIKSVAYLLDVSDEHKRAFTTLSLNTACELRERLKCQVYILCRNMKIEGEGIEKLYQKARELGVLIFKFDNISPKVFLDGKIKIEVADNGLDENLNILPDLLIVNEEILPPENTLTLSEKLKVYLDKNNFYQSKNVHFYPVSSNRCGIFFCGPCHGESDLREIFADAAVCAIKIYELLKDGKIKVESEPVLVNADKCVLCLTCLRVCPHMAIEISYQKNAPCVIDVACQMCGICAGECPAKALQLKGYSDDEIMENIGKASLIIFGCQHCASPSAEAANAMGWNLPDNVSFIEVPCAGKIDTIYLLKALEKETAKVLVIACHIESCRHSRGNLRVKNRKNCVSKILNEIGVGEEKVLIKYLAPNMGVEFIKIVDEMAKAN